MRMTWDGRLFWNFSVTAIGSSTRVWSYFTFCHYRYTLSLSIQSYLASMLFNFPIVSINISFDESYLSCYSVRL
jgi:hypothetical protein